MIELDDPVVNLDLGVNEYGALKLLGIDTIRQLLLFDVDKLFHYRQFNHAVADRIALWQKLLRKYLKYDKLHDARHEARLAEEPLKIHDSLEKCNLAETDITLLRSIGLATLQNFVESDIKQVMSVKTIDQQTAQRLQEVQDRLMRRNVPEEELEPEIVERHWTGRRYQPEEPVVVLTPDEFLASPIADAGLSENELDVLKRLSITTIQDFVESNIAALLDGVDVEDKPKVLVRLNAWRRYLSKVLHVSKK